MSAHPNCVHVLARTHMHARAHESRNGRKYVNTHTHTQTYKQAYKHTTRARKHTHTQRPQNPTRSSGHTHTIHIDVQTKIWSKACYAQLPPTAAVMAFRNNAFPAATAGWLI